MSIYTKGPWKYVDHGTVRMGDDFKMLLCNGKGAAVTEWEANARLSAAAPELLEALRGWQELLRTSYRDMTHEERAVFDAAEKAIAKAEAK